MVGSPSRAQLLPLIQQLFEDCPQMALSEFPKLSDIGIFIYPHRTRADKISGSRQKVIDQVELFLLAGESRIFQRHDNICVSMIEQDLRSSSEGFGGHRVIELPLRSRTERATIGSPVLWPQRSPEATP